MKVLVTGATGKVGNAVSRKLRERGDEVVALVRNPEAAAELLPEGVSVVQGDVRDAAACERAAQGAEAVFNCMGIYEQWLRDPGTFEAVNAQGARNVVAAARAAGAKRVVHTSTFDVFHAEQGGTVDETKLADYPKGTAYERSKQHAEELVLAEAGDGTDVVIVNPAGVYGPGPWAASGIDAAMRDAIRRRLPLCPPGGITLGFVEAVADGHIAALERGRAGERYILGGPFATVREICEIAVAEAGHGWVPPSIPVSVAKGISADRRSARAGDQAPAAAARGTAALLALAGSHRHLQGRTRAWLRARLAARGYRRDRALDARHRTDLIAAALGCERQLALRLEQLRPLVAGRVDHRAGRRRPSSGTTAAAAAAVSPARRRATGSSQAACASASARITGMRSWTGATIGLGVVVRIVVLASVSPSGERQLVQSAANMNVCPVVRVKCIGFLGALRSSGASHS